MNNYYLDFMKKTMEFQNQMLDSFSNSSRKEDAPAEGLFDRMRMSGRIYQKMFTEWMDLCSKGVFSSSSTDWNQMMNNITELSQKSGMLPFMTDWMQESSSFFNHCMDLSSMVLRQSDQFLKPWHDHSEELNQYMTDFLKGDFEAGADYMKQINKVYEETLGLIMNSERIGPLREIIGDNSKLFDSYVKMIHSYIEISSGLQSVLKEAGKTYTEKLQSFFKEKEDDGNGISFNEIYKLWISEYSQMINQFYFTEEFQTFLRDFTDNSYEFKIRSDQYLEKLLFWLPFPMNSDMKSLYKKVHELRREVRSLKKEIEELKKRGTDDEEGEGTHNEI